MRERITPVPLSRVQIRINLCDRLPHLLRICSKSNWLPHAMHVYQIFSFCYASVTYKACNAPRVCYLIVQVEYHKPHVLDHLAARAARLELDERRSLTRDRRIHLR